LTPHGHFRTNNKHEPPKGYSYAAKDYNPYYSQDYYSEQSKVPRRAQVKRVQSYYQQQQYGQQCYEEEQQWVGVYGWDACVADKGAAIVCLVNEHQGYYYSSYEPTYYEQTYQQPPYYPAYEYYTEIKVKQAQQKEYRKRAVVVAIVKEITKCTDYEVQADYGYSYDKQQSGVITAIKVSSDDVQFILDKFWEGALHYSCPSPKSYYRSSYVVV